MANRCEPVEIRKIILRDAPELPLCPVEIKAFSRNVAHPQHDGSIFGDQSETLLALPKRYFVPPCRGDVVALDKDAGHAPAGQDGLVDEVQIALVLVRAVAQFHFLVAADEWLAGRVDVVEQLRETLRRDFG